MGNLRLLPKLLVEYLDRFVKYFVIDVRVSLSIFSTFTVLLSSPLPSFATVAFILLGCSFDFRMDVTKT